MEEDYEREYSKEDSEKDSINEGKFLGEGFREIKQEPRDEVRREYADAPYSRPNTVSSNQTPDLNRQVSSPQTPQSQYPSARQPAPAVDSSKQLPSTISYETPSSTGLSGNSELSEIDRELEEILKKQQSQVKVFGVGGAGGNTISRMREIGIKGGEFIAVNTDAQDLLYSNADQKILIGKELTMGLGSGSDPKIGEEAAHESETEIKKKLAGCDMVFVTCGLGGGTGSGGAAVVSGLAKKQGALTIGVVTLPFTIEGRKRIENAEYGLERMESVTDTLIVIPNDKLLEIAPELPLQTAFKVADEILTNAVKGVTELVTKSGLVNLDFADVKAVMSNGGVSLIGMGESDSANRAQESVEKALRNPLIDADISNATGALVNIIGGNDMSLDEARAIISIVGEQLGSDAKMIWGAQISPDMEKSIRVMIIITGVKSSQIVGGELTPEAQKHSEIENELGIEFLE